MEKYSEVLSRFIKSSGMSHREVSRRTKERGVSVSQPYISQLVSGDVNPPSDDVSRVLAEVTNGDVDELLLAGYMDKAPDDIKQIIEQSKNIDKILKSIFTFYFKFSDIEKLKATAKSDGIELSDSELQELLSAKSIEQFEMLPTPEKIKILEVMHFDLYKTKTFSGDMLIAESQAVYEVDKMIKVPLLGVVAAGLPIDMIESQGEYEMVDRTTLRGRKAFFLKVKGESMIGDSIFEGDRVLVVSQNEVTSTDIAVVSINNEETTLKRIKFQNDMCILMPSNPNMEPLLMPAAQVRVIGKVIEARRSFE